MRRFCTFALIAGLAACGGDSKTPTTPVTPPTPAPLPTPSPNPYAAACGVPLPPFSDAYGFGIKVQLEPTKNKKILNANPLIKNPDYCTAAGIPFHTICNTRKEDNPERTACDHYLSGISDQGVPGPNWFEEVNGQRVKCGEPGTHCYLKPENQYLIDIYELGKYIACSGKGGPANSCGVCLLTVWDKPGSSTGGLCQLSGD